MSNASGNDRKWLEIAGAFLKIGAMSYGGPALLGVMQREFQEKRGWMSKERFVENLAVVNMLPGPVATQLAIFIGYHRAGVHGGLLAGVCFILPAFVIMLTLSVLYATYGNLPAMRHAFYGLGPVVLAIFTVAVWRLGKTALKGKTQVAIAVVSGLLVAYTPLGIVATLALAGCAGVALYHSRRTGLWAGLVVIGLVLAYRGVFALPAVAEHVAASASGQPDLWQIGVFFFKVGAFTFGGGITVLAFVQQQVVDHLQWLTAQEFIDGLALGQLTPGPIVMLAAYVGYKVHGFAGAVAGACAIFLPSFIISLSVLAMLRRFRELLWVKAALRGLSGAVIGALAVALVSMAPHAVPDLFAGFLFAITIALLLYSKLGSLTLMLGGAAAATFARLAPMRRARELF